MLSYYRMCVTLCRNDQINFGILVVVTQLTEILPKNRNTHEKYRNTREDTNTGLIKKWIYSGDYLEKPRGQFPYSPKSVSFSCSLRRLIWVYSVCISISDPMFRFFKFLVRASFVCISDEKRLYKINFFSPEKVSRHDFTWCTATSTWFLNAGQGKCCFVTVHFLGILIIIMFSIYT